jgi:hypothetical protein
LESNITFEIIISLKKVKNNDTNKINNKTLDTIMQEEMKKRYQIGKVMVFFLPLVPKVIGGTIIQNREKQHCKLRVFI